jgi:hypothetical protein
MAEISAFTQEKLAEEINSQFKNLAELLLEHHEAYKLAYALNGKFVEYCEHARILTQHTKQNVSIGGY